MTPIRSVLIIGGGSSGWMTAALLRQRLPEVKLTVIESSDIPIIGVGESTNPVMRYFHRLADVDERSFMRASNAAFKVAIRFENFNRAGGHFYHPFGQPRRLAATWFVPDAQLHHPSYYLAQAGTQFSAECAYSYQLDAGLYGEYLKQRSKRQGVRQVVDKVLQAELAPDGTIQCLKTEKSGSLAADLYVDCSGFRALLMDKTLHEPFNPATRYLLNDRAIAARVPYVDKERELKVYTNCVALSAGWVWEIPLWSRLGTGYVYSSAYLSPSEAEAEYRRYLGVERVKDLTFNHIEIRAGRHDRAWVGNCVAIGVSYGFLEPLESTGLSLTQAAIVDLARTIEGGVTEEARDSFNTKQAAVFDTTRDFVTAHFVLTTREDTPYWRHIKHDIELPPTLGRVFEEARRDSYASIEGLTHTFYEKLNWNLILSGMGMFDGRPVSRPNVRVPEAKVLARLLRDTVHEGEYQEVDVAVAAPARGAHPMWAPTW